MFRDQRAKIYVTRTRHGLPGQLFPNVGAHLVAPATNGGAEVDGELVRSAAAPGQRGDRLGGNVGRGASPARMEKSDNTGRVRDEDRYAVSDADGEADSLL